MRAPRPLGRAARGSAARRRAPTCKPGGRAAARYSRARARCAPTIRGSTCDWPTAPGCASRCAWCSTPCSRCAPSAKLFHGDGALVFAAPDAPDALAAHAASDESSACRGRPAAWICMRSCARLGGLEINELLVECGPRLAGAFIAANLVDELVLYVAPTLARRRCGAVAARQRIGTAGLACRHSNSTTCGASATICA